MEEGPLIFEGRVVGGQGIGGTAKLIILNSYPENSRSIC